jgi:ABC-2 type transport system ATP-binding protein
MPDQAPKERVQTMIELRELSKSYGKIEALRGISTTIERGEIVGLLGPNGAGKTTAMKILVGYLLPTSGSARVAGIDVVQDPIAVQSRIGYLPENAPLYGDMLVQEYLGFVGEMRALTGDLATRRIVRAAEQCAVADVLTRPIGQLSKGYRQRVGLAAAILHDPEILILDEPTNGLDPNQIVEVRELIRRMGKTKTVIVSTHILTEVEASCDRAVILIDGCIRADGSLDQLTHSRSQVVSLAADDRAAVAEVLGRLPGVSRVERTGASDGFESFRLHLGEDRELGEAVFEAARQRGWRLRELRRDDKTLEQVFRELTESAVKGVAA